AMIRLGKCYENLMVDVVPTNKKLIVRAENIVMMATGVDRSIAIQALKRCKYQAKVAIVMILHGCNEKKAKALIKKANGHIRNIKKGK
ncbi:MAG: N-acetylmuramic acid 6-phosphate etherase, partial [Bacilli bacterium]|nr:N-acetylmuramic acid 6-phosphate etherase [Bacilli bacterium]